MNIATITILSVPVFYLAYRFYARYISRVFEEDDSRPTPAVQINDGIDYVPSQPLVVFCHHFASIAAAGPIVGPTMALIYGYLPVWLWILVGCAIIGAVHDFTSMFTSIREKGRSIAEVAQHAIGKSAFLLLVAFAIVALLMVLAVFLRLAGAALASKVPAAAVGLSDSQTLFKTVTENGVVNVKIGGIASTSVIIITCFAPLLGFLLYRKNLNAYIALAVSACVCALSVYAGLMRPVAIDSDVWMFVLAVYTFFACAIPVWLVLQPRDFTNSFLLYLGVFLTFAASIIAGFKGSTMTVPALAVAEGTRKLGPIWPILFITVACGACSGFHCLVATGTSCKQISRESHVRRVGYGGMLLEGIMAIGVMIAVGAGLKYADYVRIVYPGAGIRENPILAYALGLGSLLENGFLIPRAYGTIFGILLIEGFVVTTLDTAVRLTRYLFEEIWNLAGAPSFLKNRYLNSFICVGLMLFLAYRNAVSSIWPIFGSANQLLAALALVTVSVWLARKGKSFWFAIIPAAFMLITTIASLLHLLVHKYIPGGKASIDLTIADILLLLLSAGLAFLAVRTVKK